MQYPDSCGVYVVVHELEHILEKNQYRPFTGFQRRACRTWRERRRCCGGEGMYSSIFLRCGGRQPLYRMPHGCGTALALSTTRPRRQYTGPGDGGGGLPGGADGQERSPPAGAVHQGLTRARRSPHRWGGILYNMQGGTAGRPLYFFPLQAEKNTARATPRLMASDEGQMCCDSAVRASAVGRDAAGAEGGTAANINTSARPGGSGPYRTMRTRSAWERASVAAWVWRRSGQSPHKTTAR
jgi:hypothetical protein